jgi:Zinc finger, C3HC4 type (RING finger)
MIYIDIKAFYKYKVIIMSSDISENNYVEMYCIKEGSKLRVKINTIGYLRHANVQFPRDLRIDGRRFRVLKSSVNLVCLRGKYYYSVKKKDSIEVLDYISTTNLNTITLYEDTETNECAICLCNEKNTVFIPCGHYYCCNDCSDKIRECPICRGTILQKINKSLMTD